MRKTKLAIAAAAALAATLSMAPAAQADTAIRTEPRGDAPRHIDLTRVVIDYGDTEPGTAILRVRVAGHLRAGDNVTVWFNTDPSDAGPELRLSGWVDSEYQLRSVHTWGGPGVEASCELYSMGMYRDYRGMNVRIGRDCLDDRPVRAAIRTRSAGDERQDWFRSRRTWLRGVLY